MKASLSKLIRCWVLAFLLLPGCIPYPRFTRVYSRPEYRGLVVDQNHQPIPNTEVRCVWLPQQTTTLVTGADGRVYLPAKRKFVAFELLMMDPPLQPGFIVIVEAKNPASTQDVGYKRRFPFQWSSRHLLSIVDTVELTRP